MPPQRLLVVFKATALIDLYLKDINMLFYGAFFLFKSFLCSSYTAVVHLFWCSGEGWLGYASSASIKPNPNGSNHLIRRLIDIKLSLFGLITINQTKLD